MASVNVPGSGVDTGSDKDSTCAVVSRGKKGGGFLTIARHAVTRAVSAIPPQQSPAELDNPPWMEKLYENGWPHVMGIPSDQALPVSG